MGEHIHRHRHEAMLSVEEARERILRFFDVLPTEDAPILEAQGQVLAEDVVGPFDIPPLDNSAMDGFAVQSDSLGGAADSSPVELRVVGSVAAGELPTAAVGPGTAVRIMTGAPIPDGADSVVPFEDTDESERKAAGAGADRVGMRVESRPGGNVRRAGKDVKSGELVLERGRDAAARGDRRAGVLRPPDGAGGAEAHRGDPRHRRRARGAGRRACARQDLRQQQLHDRVRGRAGRRDSAQARHRRGRSRIPGREAGRGVRRRHAHHDGGSVQGRLRRREGRPGPARQGGALVGEDASGQAAGVRDDPHRRRRNGAASRPSGQPGERARRVRAVRTGGPSTR